MDPNYSALIVALVALAGTSVSGYLSFKAQRTEANVGEKVAIFEGYDEFVAHLRSRIEELEAELGRMLQRAREAADECDECRTALQMARADYYNLTRITQAMREQMGLPAEFGQLPPGMILDKENRELTSKTAPKDSPDES